ncbi:MAG: sialidase family protein [Opitutaceae bacterium]|jgi:hypothetical protein
MSDSNIHEVSLAPPPVILNPGGKYAACNRRWQGISGIERTASGRLYATWYTGGAGEGPENHVLVVQSEDDGLSWSEPVLVIDPPGVVRAYDPVLWIDPLGRLWLLWAQVHTFWNGRGGVWFVRCDDPDAERPAWTAPCRIANGVMMNKPFVRANGEWLFPIAVWGWLEPCLPELKGEALSSVFATTDEGRTFVRRGGADVPCRCFDEHMVIERRDGSLWMLVRTHYGIGQSTSFDDGVTWTPGRPTDIPGPNSRFHLRRLVSGRLLLVNHVGFTGRSHLTASLSDDDGRTWTAHLLLDERKDVSYPDATVSADGRIRIIYDRERTGAKEILLASVTEGDILSGQATSRGSFLRRIVSKVEASR